MHGPFCLVGARWTRFRLVDWAFEHSKPVSAPYDVTFHLIDLGGR